MASLDKPTRTTLGLLLGIQFVFYLYYVLTVPLHYDEWHSLRFFSGNSFWTIISNYPAPNNHVFYNLISRLFVLTGLDNEVAVRLPSLIASLLTSYYFFKICRNFFSPVLSLILVAYVITLYPFITYSFMGRGYSFLNLFCVLTFYSSFKLSQDYAGKRYRILFIFSQFLGLYTVPSFLYALAPMYVVLGIYVLKQKKLRSFILFIIDVLISAILVVGAYSFILYNNDPQNLLNPNNGSNGFSLKDPDAFDKIFFYLNTLFFELFDSSRLPFTSVLILAAFFYNLAKEKTRSHFGVVLSVLMFFSPLIILMLHQVFPFGRNWLYLAFPVALCFGFVVQAIMHSVDTGYISNTVNKYKVVFCLLIISLTIFQLSEFGSKHRRGTPWDYELAFLRNKKLAPVAKQVRDIGKTETGLEFYPAEVIYFVSEKNNPGKEVRLRSLDENLDQDLLIISGEELPKYRKKLLRYDFMYEHNDIWIYLKRK